jgi:hypothetical protein
MVKYTCDTCEKDFPKKSNYNYHINRKYPCKSPDIEPEAKLYACNYCPSTYTRNCNLKQHLLSHVINVTPTDIKKDDDIKEEIKNIEKQLDVIKEKINVDTNNKIKSKSVSIEKEIRMQITTHENKNKKQDKIKKIIDTHIKNNPEVDTQLSEQVKTNIRTQIDLMNWTIRYIDSTL